MKYPYSKQFINKDDIKMVNSSLKKELITQGPLTEKFEFLLTQTFKSKFAVVCNSGTAALHLAYASLGLNEKNGLITSAITFVSTANAAIMCNAPVGFADVDPETGNVTLNTIKEAVKNADFKVKVICVVHLGGRPCQIAEIYNYAKSINATVVEDACHAPLSKYIDEENNLFHVGHCSHSSIATLSLHAIKHITAGEGGVLLTNDENIYNKAKKMSSHGIEKNKNFFKNKNNAKLTWFYEMQFLGFNYRLSEINCALGISQLNRLKRSIRNRNNLAKVYFNNLSNLEFVKLPKTIEKKMGTHSWHLYSVRIDFKKINKTRSELMYQLSKEGIGTQVHYIPLYKQPFYAYNKKLSNYIGSEKYYKSTLSLPMYYGLESEDVEKISKIFSSILMS